MGFILLHNHKQFEKHTMWAESVKAPLIIRGKGNTGKVTDALVEFVDMVPAVNEALGVEPLKESQGKSFLHIVEKRADKHRYLLFAEYLEDNKAKAANKTWKYIFTTGKHDFGLGYATGLGQSGIYHRLYLLTAIIKNSITYRRHIEA